MIRNNEIRICGARLPYSFAKESLWLLYGRYRRNSLSEIEQNYGRITFVPANVPFLWSKGLTGITTMDYITTFYENIA
jgi:hypothetical protein